MRSQNHLPIKKQISKTIKSFSNRKTSSNMPPYSHEHLKAKQKAFERYKKIYPVNEKQNLYPSSKTPYIGFYVLKGYKQEISTLKDSQPSNISQSANSDKIISHMLKRYLQRKQQVQMKEHEVLPRIEHSLTLPSSTGRSSMYLRPRKQNSTRVVTQQQSRRGKNSADDDRYL